jgi:hypothetical protein
MRLLLLSVAAALVGCGRPASEATGASVAVRDAEREIVLSVDRQEVEAGQPVVLSIEVRALGGLDDAFDWEAAFPIVPADGVGPFRVRALPGESVVAPDRRRRAYRLVTYETGALEIPPLVIPAAPAGDGPAASTPPIPVVVRSLVGDEEDPIAFADVRGAIAPNEEPTRRFLWPIVAVGALITLAVAAAGALILVRRSPQTPSAAARALGRLAAIEKSGSAPSIAIAECADTLRDYIADRFGLRAPQSTTRELLDRAQGEPAIGDAERSHLALFLAHADRVKFAAGAADAQAVAAALAGARRFVAATTPSDAAGRSA